ncbi:DGQHR domain-containing protein [Spirosoma taeanense]|uniref:DGQHR domain-containing protein n=1 Tax=Spirosoma taeanense TaxID=2735870 RepID=A0A6M5YE51_9BACT|nr:DGQHR domain-containing protein [Spirosoma taeanense]QJW91600.1 DGQHR domain-containing protein [Spirosoma taeanense]
MNTTKRIPIIEVDQWLKYWDTVAFDSERGRKQPQHKFFIFSINAGLLKKLSKVYPRKADEQRDIEIGIQRKHDPARSTEIKKYIHRGYPLSEMASTNSIPDKLKSLQMPGWLPTVIVANILTKGTRRGKEEINEHDLITIEKDASGNWLKLPDNVSNEAWIPHIPPIEIIDGQHRLWAFDKDDSLTENYELPVVAFIDLDITWQAYLFYTINVKPKKINRSLAYDLYPILRVQEWLEGSPDTANIYKETRAQEIVEILWSNTESPWKNKINMLGDSNSLANITQAAFIRNLIASFIKTSVTKGLGGLFGSILNDQYHLPLNWNRTQQAAFIIFSWKIMYERVSECQHGWALALRNEKKQVEIFKDKDDKSDLAFFSKYSLISTDQGVRGFLHVINDICYLLSESINLRNVEWTSEDEIKEGVIGTKEIQQCLRDLNKHKVYNILYDVWVVA